MLKFNDYVMITDDIYCDDVIIIKKGTTGYINFIDDNGYVAFVPSSFEEDYWISKDLCKKIKK